MKSTNRGAILELWKKHRSQITKTKSWKSRRAETIDGKPSTKKTTSMKTKLWTNPTRCSFYLSQNLRKKKTNTNRNNIQRCKKQLHNMELIYLIYNKYQIISQKKKLRKNKSTEVSLLPVMVRSISHQRSK